MTPSFRLLIDRLQQGRPGHFAETVVERFTARLAALTAKKMTARLQQRVAPEDVIQSVFATFFRRMGDGQFELRDWDSLWSLLARIAVWRICKHSEYHGAARRAINKEVSLEPGLDLLQREPSPNDVLVAEELQKQLLESLAERYRPIVLQILGGATHEAIVEDLHTSLSTVERVHRRARETLLALLASEEC